MRLNEITARNDAILNLHDINVDTEIETMNLVLQVADRLSKGSQSPSLNRNWIPRIESSLENSKRLSKIPINKNDKDLKAKLLQVQDLINQIENIKNSLKV